MGLSADGDYHVNTYLKNLYSIEMLEIIRVYFV
ncbi:hypothetical protein SDC9_203990 [bioreactor metagenome]|jgi:hypothetical protein|uniref:Uncharacterized protein n=2 Tax=root TaxID=1 RepID=A0ABM5Y829_ANAPI|nr:hypothetical protein CPRO_05020 [Anaerotignum propionicum DSM 1682]